MWLMLTTVINIININFRSIVKCLKMMTHLIYLKQLKPEGEKGTNCSGAAQ